MTEWQPIETAPRDGSDFIAYINNGYISRARFMNGKFFAADSLGPRNRDTSPSFWMPLPEPPVKP